MAKKKATAGSFKKGDGRAAAAGRKSSISWPPELTEARKMNRAYVEATLTKYMHMSRAKLMELEADDNLSSWDLCIIAIIREAQKHGNPKHLDFLLDRTIGRVKIEADIKVDRKNVHSELMERMHGNQVIDVTNRSTDKSKLPTE